ncbi:MAG TPA: hypothetical protein VES90_04925 [Candidatus Eisenbacteria bacterium]|nr:hypothetical protein [Candidatus Eisenbacteria bacterium]
MSSSRRPSKRPSGVKAVAKRATAKRTAAAGTKAKGSVASRPSTPTPAARRAIRLAGSASSRLTIKPGVPAIPRAKLELSTKPRPGGLRPLSQVELDEDEVLVDAFDATLDGVKVRITAVLERTCVYVGMDGDRKLARKDDIWIEANKLPIRRRALT